MNVSLIDWSILLFSIIFILGVTVYSKRYSRTVSDFLAADRLAGRYLLTVSGSFYGAISLVAMWEMVYTTGLPPQWWNKLQTPALLFMSLTGFIIYRFRQTRALTLAQFFEERYSRKFRYFAGLLCWISGVINYGIFPLVTSNFLIHYLNLPTHFEVGGIEIATSPCVMAIYLSIAIYIACSGGQITIMITDFLQGSFMMLVFVAVMLFLLAKFSWGDIMLGLETGAPAGKSMINPLGGSATEDFSIWFFLINLFAAIYNAKSWQATSGYNAAAKTPHEAVMAGVIGSWRLMATQMSVILIPLVAFAVLHLDIFADIAAPIKADIASLGDPQLQTQMTVPIFLRHILPIGVNGIFAAVILGCALTVDDTYTHSWGSIFVQDVVMPLRNKPLTPKTHMLFLRLSVIGVGLFAFLFSCFFPLKDYILMFFAFTGAIYLGGAGAVIIGGLYWKRGTTAAAWTALLIGTVLGFGGLVLQQTCPELIKTIRSYGIPMNGQWIYFYAMITASISYVLVSLLGPKQVYNMDKLLHRGEYAIQDDVVKGDEASAEKIKKFSFAKLVGVTAEFSKFERFVFYASFCWSMLWFALFVIGTAGNLLFPQYMWWDWNFYWMFYIGLSILFGIICTFWVFFGGLRDAKRLFIDLKNRVKESADDDGFVRK